MLKHKKVLSFMMAVILVFGMIPTVYAVETTEAETTAPTETTGATQPTETEDLPANDDTVPATTEAIVIETTEVTVPETTEATVPATTEVTVPETTEETVPETTEEVCTCATENDVHGVDCLLYKEVAYTVGDAESIMARLDQMYMEAAQLTSYDECDTFFAEVREVYFAAFENNVRVVSAEEMAQINEKYYLIEDYLAERFGYLLYMPAVSNYSGRLLRSGSSGAAAAGAVVTNKTVEEGATENEFLLTLEAYVTGEATTTKVTKPADIVLVIDQSASMYALMGEGTQRDNTALVGTNVGDSVTYLRQSDLAADSTLWESAKQLGYYSAQSQNTKNWFVVQYVETDAETPWYFYERNGTGYGSWDGNSNFSYNGDSEIRLTKYASLDPNVNNGIGVDQYIFYKTQFGALYDAMSAFVKEMSGSDADHRIAVVGFASDINNADYQDGSGVYLSGGSYVKYAPQSATNAENLYANSLIGSDTYREALVDASNLSNVMSMINAVKTDYLGTAHFVGLDMAYNILNNAPSVETDTIGRDKIVILFTDGSPSPYAVGAWNNLEPAKEATVERAAKLKAMGAQVYSIWTSTLTSAPEFLDYASSNYPDAKSMSETGDAADNKYAKGITTGQDLMNAFTSITQDVSSASVILEEETILRDVITGAFTLPYDLTSQLDGASEEEREALIKNYIRVYTADYEGKDEFGDPVEYADAIITVTKNDKELYVVEVKNFDYSENYVADLEIGGPRGKKLIVEIPVERANSNIGGNGQATNDPESGIYLEDVKQKEFGVPSVDTPTTVKVKKIVVGANADKNVKFEFSTTYRVYGDSNSNDVAEQRYSSLMLMDESGSNHLEAVTKEKTESFELEADGVKEFLDVYVGGKLTIRETANADYAVTVTAKGADGKDISVTEKDDGSFEMDVVPGMEITVTNTLQKANLTIVKNIDKANPDQSFLFRVTNVKDNTTMPVMIPASAFGTGTTASVTIENLEIGNYTVEELIDWSWRYSVQGDARRSVELKPSGETVSFTNTRTNDYWLDGEDHKENKYTGIYISSGEG